MYNVNEEIIIASTGEVITLGDIKAQAKAEAYGEMVDRAKRQQKAIEKLKKIDSENDAIASIGGYYYHLLFKNVLDEEFEDNYIIRFCRLCTHLNYDNVLVKNIKDGKVKLLEEELAELWKLSRAEADKTKKYLVNNKLIFIDDDGVVLVNKKYAIRGTVKGNNDMTRVFINGFNELYEKVSPRQHKLLATFIKVLPYLNSEFNILCENPTEKDKRLVRPINWTQLGCKMGLTLDQSKKLKSKLFKLRIDNKKVMAEWKDDTTVKLIVNPAIFWKANESNISEVANLFEI